jgi:hypothetical protein
MTVYWQLEFLQVSDKRFLTSIIRAVSWSGILPPWIRGCWKLLIWGRSLQVVELKTHCSLSGLVLTISRSEWLTPLRISSHSKFYIYAVCSLESCCLNDFAPNVTRLELSVSTQIETLPYVSIYGVSCAVASVCEVEGSVGEPFCEV